MADSGRLDKLIQAYDQERQDERTYWSTTGSFVLGALAVILALTSAPPDGLAWGTWVVAPAVGTLVLSYWVYQSAVGAMRRQYMEALEVAMSEHEQAIQVDESCTDIRPFAYNRYTWSLTSNQEAEAPRFIARFYFRAMTFTPGVLLAAVDGVSIGRLAIGGERLAALVVGVLSVVLLGFLYWSLWLLQTKKTRDAAWSKAAPIP